MGYSRLILSVLLATTGIAAFADEPQANPSLAAVQSLMQTAQKRLEMGDLGSQTQAAQSQIVDHLSALIGLAEQNEKSQKSSAAAASGSQSQPAAAGSPSANPGSQAGKMGGGSRGTDTAATAPKESLGPQSPWSTLRDKQRDPVYNAMEEKFPARYRELVEQYYKSFGEPAAKEPSRRKQKEAKP